MSYAIMFGGVDAQLSETGSTFVLFEGMDLQDLQASAPVVGGRWFNSNIHNIMGGKSFNTNQYNFRIDK